MGLNEIPDSDLHPTPAMDEADILFEAPRRERGVPPESA